MKKRFLWIFVIMLFIGTCNTLQAQVVVETDPVETDYDDAEEDDDDDLEDDDVEDVAGGYYYFDDGMFGTGAKIYNECSNDFTDTSCWWDDACDMYVIGYFACDKNYHKGDYR